jgi:exportin-2 (importin alpha re-exporter)
MSVLHLFSIQTLPNSYALGANKVIVTARQSLLPGYQTILQRLIGILDVISKNPSNPNFDHYLFESLSGLMKCGIRDFEL